ncbi:Gfo/Idh/MocA family protein [Jatrophihabitans sp. YIM 134969]
MTTLRWGIVGTGLIADMMARDLARSTERGDHVVAAVGSRSQESADRFGDAHDVPAGHRHASYADLVADDTVDVVYVATPHPMHLADTKLALEAGKHVLVEKAFTMNADQAREIVALATQKNLFCMEAMWTRFLPHMVRIREIVASGTLGRIEHVSADHGQWFPADPAFRLFAPELGGSALLDLGVYPVSFASMVFGGVQPARIATLVDPAFNGVVDGQTSMLFGYPEGGQALLTCTSGAKTATRASIVGTDARIDIDPNFYEPTSFTIVPREGEPVTETLPFEGRGMVYQADEVKRCLEAGAIESDVLSLTETVHIMETMDAVLADAGMSVDPRVLRG